MLQQANIETCRPTSPVPQPSPVKHGTVPVCAEPANVAKSCNNVYHCSRLIATYTKLKRRDLKRVEVTFIKDAVAIIYIVFLFTVRDVFAIKCIQLKAKERHIEAWHVNAKHQATRVHLPSFHFHEHSGQLFT